MVATLAAGLFVNAPTARAAPVNGKLSIALPKNASKELIAFSVSKDPNLLSSKKLDTAVLF